MIAASSEKDESQDRLDSAACIADVHLCALDAANGGCPSSSRTCADALPPHSKRPRHTFPADQQNSACDSVAEITAGSVASIADYGARDINLENAFFQEASVCGSVAESTS